MALYGEKLSFKVSLRVGGRVPNYNATSGPQLTAEAEFESVELVSWGQVWQKGMTYSSDPQWLPLKPFDVGYE